MIAISDHTLKYFAVQTFSRVLRLPSILLCTAAGKNADSTQSIRAFESFSHSCSRASQLPPRRNYFARQPFQLFRRVSSILLLNGERVRECELDNPMLRRCCWRRVYRYSSPSGRFTVSTSKWERPAINLASVSGGERIKPKAITRRLLSYPVNRRTGGMPPAV